MINAKNIYRNFTLIILVSLVSVTAAERPFDLQKMKLGRLPANYISGSHGTGKSSLWEITEIEVPSSLNPNIFVKKHVLAHVGKIQDSDNYPVLFHKDKEFEEIKVTARLRITGGKTVQAAGIIFGAKDDKNFLLIALKPATKELYATDITNGSISKARISAIPAPKDGWYNIILSCRSRRISWVINGETYPELLAPKPVRGKVGVWTRGDTACEFSLIKIEKPETIAQKAVNLASKNNKHVSILQLIAEVPKTKNLSIVASSRPNDLGKKIPEEQDVKKTLKDGTIFYRSDKKTVRVTMPVRDQDGIIIAAAYIYLKPSGNRIKHNALASAIVLKIEEQVQDSRRLFQ